MAAVDSNSLSGFLAVFAQESLTQFIAQMPKFNLFTKNFDSSIANGGVSVTTRISTTNWGTANDLTQGYASTAATSSAITAVLKIRDFDTIYNELEWTTITPQMLINTFFKPQAVQLANSIVVDAISNVTSSYFTNTVSVASSSLFTVTGSNSLQEVSTTLDNLEIPREDRFCIVAPSVYQGLVGGILPTYIYGSPEAVQKNQIPNVLGFGVDRYARFYGAAKPQGGDSYGGGDKLVGICGNPQGLVAAVRAPIEINNGFVQSATAVDESSGLSLQTRIVYDVSKPGWRLVVASVFGTAAGNPNAIVPIITESV